MGIPNKIKNNIFEKLNKSKIINEAPASVPQPPSAPSQDKEKEISALEKIKYFSLLAIIGFLLLGIGAFSTLFGMFGAMSFGPFYAPMFALTIVFAFVLILLIGAIILLLGLFRLREGLNILRQIDMSFDLPYTGTTLIVIGLILIIIGAILTIVLIGFFALIVALILLFIGEILTFIIGSFRFNDRYKDSLFMVAGILFIIGIFVSILSFIAVILWYVALGNTINRLRAA